MNCLISRNKETNELEQVFAPNQKPSLLYRKILSAPELNFSLSHDPYVQAALQKNLILNSSKPEIALALWSKIHTKSFKDWYGDWTASEFEGSLDKNGEPDVLISHDGSFIKLTGKTFFNLDEIPADLVYNLGTKPIYNNPIVDFPKDPIVKRKFERLQQDLKSDNPSLLFEADELDDGKVKIKKVLQTTAGLTNNRLKLQDVINRLQGLFPSLRSKVIAEDQLTDFLFGNLQVDLEKVNSFVKDGIVYLVDGRAKADHAVEEYLHPFVHVLQSENPELFQNLLKETHERYPALKSQIDQNYSSSNGFTENDRQNEIVTRAITYGLSNKITQQPTVGDYNLSQLLRQFLQIIQNVIRKITGKNRLYVGAIPTNISIDEIISLLDEGLQFDLGQLSKHTYFNLTDERLDVYNRVLDEANDIQKEIIENLAKNNALFFEDSHKYIHSETGDEYTSITKLIKGQIDDEDPYAINRAFGKEFDFIMNSIVLGHSFDEIRSQIRLLKPEVLKDFYNYFKIFQSGVRSNGAVIIPQLVLADDQSMRAGTLDLLIIDPEGNLDIIDLKVSKNSILGKSYDKHWEITYEPSVFLGSQMTTRQQHGIQQHAYKKLVELTGPINGKQPYVRSVKTLHFRIGVSNNTVIGFEPEGYVDHTTTNYNSQVDKIIPTDLPKSIGYTTLLQAQALPENAPVIERIQDVVEQFLKKLRDRKSFYENINSTTTGKTTASENYLAELAEIINQVNEEIEKGSPAAAFYHLIKFINNDLKRKTEQIASTTVAKEKLVGFLLETEKDLKDYMELLSNPKLTLNNPTLIKLGKEALEYSDSLRTVIDVEIKDFIKTFVKNNSSRNFSEEELNQLLQETRDISQADYLLGDLATSTDTLLATLDKVYKSKLQEVYDFTDEVADKLKDLGNRLAQLSGGKPVYDFMIHRDSKGLPTGYYVRKIGSQYWSRLKALREKIEDENNQILKYREVFNLSTATEEDKQFNLQLMEDKNALRSFMQAETVDTLGRLLDGNYHRYTEEFKATRDMYEYLYVEMIDGEAIFHEWRKRENITDSDYKKYLAKYYTEEISYLSPVKERLDDGTYEYQGRVVERSGRFVKNENAEVREYTGEGESMLDPKFEKLMKPQTELEKVQKEFYDTWTSLYEKQLEKLPADQRRRMAGRLPLVWDRYIKEIKSKPTSVVNGILKGIRSLNPFDLKIYSHNVLTNEDGEIENQVPIFYVGNFQNEKTIEQLENKILEMKDQLRKKEINLNEYKEKIKRANQALLIEKGKITPDKLSTDMVRNLVTFARMAELNKVMSAFESTVKTIHKVAVQRKYNKEGSAGIIQSSSNKEAAKFDSSQSLMVKRLEKWMEMVFYQSINPYQSKTGQIVAKMMNYLSLKSVALNPFGQLNNYLVGNITNTIEAAGGIYWDRSAYTRAISEFNLKYIPGFLAKRSSKLIPKGDYYIIDKAYSKYEALASKFRMMRKLESAELSKGYRDSNIDIAYFLQESAEYNIQTKTGMAILMTKKLTNSITGEQFSIFDAYDFDQKTGKLIIKNGFDLTDQYRHEITNYIYEVNKKLHGNYAEEDKMVIQQHLLGQLAAQFHKHVYPFFTSRYGKAYVDENLGDTEGRYRSVWNFMSYTWDLKSIAEGWNNLSDLQKRNIYKSSADLAFMILSLALYQLFSSIGKGVDDDDDTTKKFVNLLTAQSDRLYDEIAQGVFVVGTVQQYQMLKSPLAMLGFAKDGLEVVYEAMKAPFPPYDDLYYKRGIHKDELRVKKELMDVIPLLNLINRWDSYETVKQFYIR